MKLFEMPEVELVKFDVQDVITTSDDPFASLDDSMGCI